MEFKKMDGAGNDFVVVDNRTGFFNLSQHEIAHICHRRFGVGADGLMTLDQADEGHHFVMRYYNSDGRLGSMCGNGGRCIAAFAFLLGMGKELNFIGFDGEHRASILEWNTLSDKGIVDLGMRDVECNTLRKMEGGVFIDTGSPHFVVEVADIEHFDVYHEGRRLRNRTDLFPEGANIDFVQPQADGRLALRTYERGVEDETWACGTGVTAAALVMNCNHLSARGGEFEVCFNKTNESFKNVHLIGPVSLNYSGQWTSSQA